jgi:hypothetical protein
MKNPTRDSVLTLKISRIRQLELAKMTTDQSPYQHLATGPQCDLRCAAAAAAATPTAHSVRRMYALNDEPFASLRPFVCHGVIEDRCLTSDSPFHSRTQSAHQTKFTKLKLDNFQWASLNTAQSKRDATGND